MTMLKTPRAVPFASVSGRTSMKWKLINNSQEKTFALIFDKGDEAMAGLLAFAKDNHLTAAHMTAIGAFSQAVLGYFDRQTKEYKKIPVDEQVEVLSLIGDVALDRGQPKIHAHVVVGCSDGTTRGGHLLEAHVWPTLEVIVVESPKHLQRTYDPETGLDLINLSR
jgi:predicted DNA-binding protein with PD1-like motif